MERVQENSFNTNSKRNFLTVTDLLTPTPLTAITTPSKV
jgi:hypothetical protein